MALREHCAYNKTHVYDEALSSFFRNVRTTSSGPINMEPGSRINDLRARSIIVDMENGVIENKILGGELRDLFEPG